MPIRLKPCTITTEYDLTEWSVADADRDRLVDTLAYLYLRQEENASRIIQVLDPRRRIPPGLVAENVVHKLTAPRPVDLHTFKNGNEREKEAAEHRIKASIWHRDGLLFQHLSWIVARQSMPKAYMTAPHVRHADKGFDGFIIEFNETQERLERIILCEDKASTNPRSIITSSVWKEIEAILRGERDDEVLADLTTLLKGVPGLDAEGVEDVVDAIFWDEARQFRVCVATGEDHRREGGFGHILKGFEGVAPGVAGSWIGGVLAFRDVRDGLNCLAEDVVARVRELSRKELAGV